MANKQYESGYKSFAPTDVHEVDMDRRADWNETDVLDPSYILNKPNVVSTETQSDWNENDNTKTAFIKNKPTIPDAPVQSNWNETDPTSLAYIRNKPSLDFLPISGGTLTGPITREGTAFQTPNGYNQVYISNSYAIFGYDNPIAGIPTYIDGLCFEVKSML